jgi:Protein of unknown function (DUF1501)
MPSRTNLQSGPLSRRWFLHERGVGLGAIALRSLLEAEAPPAGAAPLAPKPSPLPARAKRVIFLFMAGGPSQLELFDDKPKLREWSGRPPPPDLVKDYRTAFINPNSALLGSRFKFSRHGASGARLSELLPGLATVADELCIVRSMISDAVNHTPGQLLMNTGSQQFGRPSLGAWTLYGLGSESANLPGYVVLTSTNGASGGVGNYGSGFLPSSCQGVAFHPQGDPVPFLSNPRGFDQSLQRMSLDAMADLNGRAYETWGDPETTARVQAFELAYRMQASAPELVDFSSEPGHVLESYGVDPAAPSFARNCLLARRLVERGVRFVHLVHEMWDQHKRLNEQLTINCRDTDRPVAALISDLKQRGLLDDTLVIWGGEFGRTPMVQNENGRDHHNRAFTMWLAGGGVRVGTTLGETDELGFNVVRDPVHVHDLHATLLHLLGFDHKQLTVRHQGRDFRLTDVYGRVVPELLG